MPKAISDFTATRRTILAGLASFPTTFPVGTSAAASGALLAAMPLPPAVHDPIFAIIERHRAAGIAWDAAVDVSSTFPDGPDPMAAEQRGQRDILEAAVDEAREALNNAGSDLIGTAPTTAAGIASAIAYVQRQLRNDGTYMPFDIEFHYDAGYHGDGGVVLGWLDRFLNTIAVAGSTLDARGGEA